MSVKEIKVCIPEVQYNITQNKLGQYRINKTRINFLEDKINRLKSVKECEKRLLDTLEQKRNKTQTQIDSMTKELEILYSKPRTRKKRSRIQSLNGIRSVLIKELMYNLTKARIYRIIKSINGRLIEYIHDYRKRLEQNQVISKELKEIVANNVNWCEITDKSENKQIEFNIPSLDDRIPKVSYETDIISIEPRVFPYDGATQEDLGIRLNAIGEYGIAWFQTTNKIDPNRSIKIRLAWRQQKAGGGTISMSKTFNRAPLNGSASRVAFLGPDSAETLASRSQTRYGMVEWEIASGDVYMDYIYDLIIKDGAADQDWYITDVSIKYFRKRVID